MEAEKAIKLQMSREKMAEIRPASETEARKK